MPAETQRQANFMRLVAYYKKHGRMPSGMGKASKNIRDAAGSMSTEQVGHYTSTKKRRGTVLTGRG